MPINPGTTSGLGGLPRDPRQDVRTRRALAKLGGTALTIDNATVTLDDNGRLQVGVGGILGTAHGGTGIDASGVLDGQVLIGRTSDHTFGLATLTQGTNVTITDAGHSITINAASGVPAATEVGQVLYSLDGSTFTAQSPVTSAEGGWLVNDGGLLIVRG